MTMDSPACFNNAASASSPVPYTLLGFLLWGKDSSFLPGCYDGDAGGFGFSQFMWNYAERGKNAMLWVLLVAVTALLLRRIAGLVRFWELGSRIPGPPCISLHGRGRFVPHGGDVTDCLSKLHEKYGSVIKLWLSPTQLLVSITDPVAIKEVLVEANDKLPLLGRAFRLAFGSSSLFVPSFEKVKKRRESLAFHLNKKLFKGGNSFSLKILDHVLNRDHSVMAKGSLDCWLVSHHLAFYILGVTIFGDAFFAWPNATAYEELLMQITKDASTWASYDTPPVWKRGFWRYQCLCSKLKYLTKDIIQQYRQKCKLFNERGNNPFNKNLDTRYEAGKSATSFLDDNLTEGFSFGDIYQHLVSKEEPCGNVMSVMFHGCLRITSLITIVLARLALCPEVQEQIYSEIMEVQKGMHQPETNAVQKMQLLLATVYESARLLPEGSLLQRCSLKHDLTLKTGITIPAGALLVIPVQLVQKDYSVWSTDACLLHPHHFLSKPIDRGRCDADVKPVFSSFTGCQEILEDYEDHLFHLSEPNSSTTFLPFGFGTRACIAQKFVIHGISTLFASLLQNYEVRLQPGSDNSLNPRTNHFAQRLSNPKIVFSRRESRENT